MISPPKKKPTQWLKDIQAKQLSSLQIREQKLLDLIEDMRLFAKQRADIEKTYAQSLLKLSGQMLAKKDLLSDEEALPSEQYKLVQTAWKSCLEETDKIGRLRLKASEIYSPEVSEKSKTLKTNKTITVRKTLEYLSNVNADFAQSVKDFNGVLKQYTEDETNAYEARRKAFEAESRLSNKETGIFSSYNTLKKNTSKTFDKMNTCTSKAEMSRNAYFLELAAINAHAARLHTEDMPKMFQALDRDVFEQMSSFMSTMVRAEMNVCNEALDGCNRAVKDAESVGPEFNLNCFLKNSQVFSSQIHFVFDPVQDDQVTSIRTDDGTEKSRLEKETKNWAKKVAFEMRRLTKLQTDLTNLTNDSTSNTSEKDMATTHMEVSRLQHEIRRCEIAKLKADARLEVLKSAGMPVDELLAQATSESEAADSVSITSFSSGQHSVDTHSFDSSSEPVSSPRASDAPHLATHTEVDNRAESLYKAIAIYDYQANHEDELSLVAGEYIEILDNGSGDGWLQACNSHGAIGLVPENYIETLSDDDLPPPPDEVMSEVNIPAETTPSLQQPSSGIGQCRALFDHYADGDDEISFTAGQVITIISRDENGIDDGYWKGEVDGRQGMFPSMVVEEIFNDGYQTEEQFDRADNNCPTSIYTQEVNMANDQGPTLSLEDVNQNFETYQSAQSTADPIAKSAPTLYHHSQSLEEKSEYKTTGYNSNISNPVMPTRPEAESKPPVDRSKKPVINQTKNSVELPPNVPPWERNKLLKNAIKQPDATDVGEDEGRYSKNDNVELPARRPLYSENREVVAPRKHPQTQFNVSESPMSTETPASLPAVEESPNTQSESNDTEHVSTEKPPDLPYRLSDPRPSPRRLQPSLQVAHDVHQSGQEHDNPPSMYAPQGCDPYGSNPPAAYKTQHVTDYTPRDLYSQHGTPSGQHTDPYKQHADPYSQHADPHSQHADPYSQHGAPYKQHADPYSQHADPRGRSTSAPVTYYPPHVEDVENRRFRQLQPVPHQYYISQSEGRNNDRVTGRSSDIRDRALSGRSNTSQSSSDSQDNLNNQEKQTPIKIPGRRHLSSSSSSNLPEQPTTPLTLRQAAHMLPKSGLVNPSYRVAIDMTSSPSKQSPNARTRVGPSRRLGGLPGHVRQGIVQGRQALTEVAHEDLDDNDSKLAAPHRKSETAV